MGYGPNKDDYEEEEEEEDSEMTRIDLDCKDENHIEIYYIYGMYQVILTKYWENHDPHHPKMNPCT